MWGAGKRGRTKILLVDYERDFAKALKIRLKDNGYDVLLAFDSIQGVVMARKERPHLIILEVMIPGGGGVAVAKRLKLSTDTSHIPIIVLTDIPGVEERVYEAGAFYHLMKPYNPHELLGVIRMALEQPQGSAQNPPGLAN